MAQAGKMAGSRKGLRAKAKKQKRTVNSRTIRRRYLIACEGKATEPNYFNELKRRLPKDIIILPKGDGRNTLGLVAWAESEQTILKRTGESPDEVWIVMDKDSFPDHKFDNAIQRAQSKGFNLAWSNECFELWILLHFEDVTHTIARKDIYKKLSHYFGFNYEKDGKNKCLYSLIIEKGGDEDKAITRAEKLWQNKVLPFSKSNPATGVYRLISELNKLTLS